MAYGDLFEDIHSSGQLGDLYEFTRRVYPAIDRTITKLAAVKFDIDPLAREFSRQSSIIESAKKRQGHIIELALREALKESNRYLVWSEPNFRVSADADMLAKLQSRQDGIQSTLPYGVSNRLIQLDCIVFDAADSRIASYEVKRGFGLHDAGKNRSIRHDLHCVQLLLKSYGETRRLTPRTAIARIIYYYGKGSIKRPLALIGDELDEHFQFPILVRMRVADRYYQDKVHALIRGNVQ